MFPAVATGSLNYGYSCTILSLTVISEGHQYPKVSESSTLR